MSVAFQQLANFIWSVADCCADPTPHLHVITRIRSVEPDESVKSFSVG